eukprot:4412704-Amphidinium_carterae.1
MVAKRQIQQDALFGGWRKQCAKHQQNHKGWDTVKQKKGARSMMIKISTMRNQRKTLVATTTIAIQDCHNSSKLCCNTQRRSVLDTHKWEVQHSGSTAAQIRKCTLSAHLNPQNLTSSITSSTTTTTIPAWVHYAAQ